MKVRLISVQLKMALDDYTSFQAFESRLQRVMGRVAAHLEPDTPSLVVFPEHLGFYLGSVPFHPQTAFEAGTFQSFVSAFAPGDRNEIQHHLFIEHAVEVWDFYSTLFSGLAQRYGVYIVAGSLSLPEMDRSPHRSHLLQKGIFVQDTSKLFNISPAFNPFGRCILRTAKRNIPSGEDLFVDAATADWVFPVRTAIGNIGTILCYDGYHHRPIERLDALGCQVLCQPVHFPGPEIRFDGSGELVPAYEDFIKLIQGRENIRFGVSSALVGEVFRDRRSEGLSFIARNANLPEDRWQEALICQAKDPFEEQILAATATW